MLRALLILSITVLVTATALAAGCGRGGDAASSSDAASLAPADALFYAEATLRPEGDRKAAIDALVAKFPGEGTAGERITRLLKESLAEDDPELSWERDFEPWIGDEAAVFAGVARSDGDDGDGALLIASEDEDATAAMLEKDEAKRKTGYRGRTLYVYPEGTAGAVVDGALAFGNPGAIKAMIDVAEDGGAIGDDEAFEQALEDVSEERLGFMYFNAPAFAEELRKSPVGGPFMQQFKRFFAEPMVATVDADENGVRFEGTVPASLLAGFPVVAEGSDLAGELPSDAWLAMAQPELGKAIDAYVEMIAGVLGGRDVIAEQLRAATGLDLQEDVIDWMGDWGVFVRGTNPAEIEGALIVETSDEAASGRAIDAVARLSRQCGCSIRPLELGGGGEGITIQAAEAPQPIHLFQRDGKVVLAYGDAAARDALEPAETLADSPAFADAKDALGGDYAVSFYMAFEPLLRLVDTTEAAADEDWQEARPYLEPLGALVGGAREDGDKLRSAFGLTVK